MMVAWELIILSWHFWGDCLKNTIINNLAKLQNLSGEEGRTSGFRREMRSTNWLGVKVGSGESACLGLGQTLGEGLVDGQMG